MKLQENQRSGAAVSLGVNGPTSSVTTLVDQDPEPWAVVRLATPCGPVYLATDEAVADDLRGFPDPDGNPRVVLTRDEIDGLLSVVCRIAPADHLKLTLWRELRALVALKRALPGCGPAVFGPVRSGRPLCALCTPEHGALPAQPAAQPTPQPETRREQLALL